MCACSVVSELLQPCGLWPARLLCAWDSPGKHNWSELPFPTPGGHPNPVTEPKSFSSPELAGGFFTSNATREANFMY